MAVARPIATRRVAGNANPSVQPSSSAAARTLARVRIKVLWEQLRREVSEVSPPVVPGVATVGFLKRHVELMFPEHCDRGPRSLDEKVVLACGEPEQLE